VTDITQERLNEDEDLALLERRVEASRRILRDRLHPADDNPDASHSAQSGTWSALFGDVMMPEITQFARRHPVAVLAGSALAGALLVWARPWRGIIGSVLLTNAIRKMTYVASTRTAPHLFQYWMNQRRPARPRSDDADAAI
jgi:hypothetical protein